MLTTILKGFTCLPMALMRAARWYGPEHIQIDEVEIPQVGPGEVLVRVETALTCGTDFKLFRQGHPVLVKSCPAPFGHELAGTVVETGPGVSGRFQMGTRVVVANSAPCDACFFCERGQFNLCENLEFLNGAYAEYLRIPAQIVRRNFYPIPDTLSFREAAFTEPLACVLHCVERLRLQPKENICVIGAGTCGLLFTRLAKLRGARVMVLGRGEEKLAVARQMGADHVLSIRQEGFMEEIASLCRGYGPDKVIDAVGIPSSWEMAVGLVRKGGAVWFYGGCAKGTTVSLDTYHLHYNEISCHGIFHHTPEHFAKALDLVSQGLVDTNLFIRGEKKLSELHEVFRPGMPANPLKTAIIP